MKSQQEILIELRTGIGMNRKEFAQYLGIPYRTMADWEHGERKMPDYLLRLIEYKVRTDQLFKKNFSNEQTSTNNGTQNPL